MSKIIIIITTLSLLNFIGCYYQEQMTPSNYDFDENEDLEIVTKDSVYSIKYDHYYFENDTLFATQIIKVENQPPFKVNAEIPVEEIQTVEVERINTLVAVFSVIGIVIGVLLALISAHSR